MNHKNTEWNSMLSTQLANILRKRRALETRLYLIVVWFYWKMRTEKEGNCTGRSEVRILLTCIQLLLQFLHVIWSMPTNFSLFKKPLDKFFLYTCKSPDQSSINVPCFKFQEHWKQGRLVNNVLKYNQFSPQILCLKLSVLIIHWHCFQVSNAGAQLAKKKLHQKERSITFRINVRNILINGLCHG